MTRWILRGAALLLTLLGAFALASNVTFADPPLRGVRGASGASQRASKTPPVRDPAAFLASGPGYTLIYSFSADPQDDTYSATYAPDVKAIYAWARVEADTGAPEKQFTVETEFLAPDGAPVDSEWYQNDTGTVTTTPPDPTNLSAKNVARRVIQVAGTPNADQIGQWTVNFSIGGKIIATGNFSLEDATDIAQGDLTNSQQQILTDAGYDVVEFTQATGKTGNIFAYAIMLPASQDLYSSDTTQQIVDGFAALRQAFQDATKLYVFLRYDQRYEVAYFTEAASVDAYLKDNDFDAFAGEIGVDVYDNQEQKYLGAGYKDFIQKNFGAGTYSPPTNPPLSKTSTTVSSVRVTVSPSELPADGASKAIVTVQVYDKRNQPLVDQEVSFDTSGSGQGTIRPRVTSTDENGEADAIFTAGKKDGSVTITATAAGVTGTGVVTLGSGSDDPAADNVITYLSGQGFQASDVGFYDNAHTVAGVVIDLGTSFTSGKLVAPIVFGMAALRDSYPDAANLVVLIPYQANYLLFQAKATEFDDFVKAYGSADTDNAQTQTLNDFLSLVFAKSSYIDHNGNKLATFKDFFNKNFTGG